RADAASAIHRLHARKPASSQAQYAALLYTPPAPRARYQLRLPTSRLRARRARVPPSVPPFTYPFRFLPTFPSLASTSSTPSPFLVSLLPPRLTARYQPTAQPHRSINAGWHCLPSRAARADSCTAVLCGSGSASKIPSTRCRLCGWSRNPPGAHSPSHPAFVLHPLPFSSKPPCAARLWTSPPTRDL
ncbi:hypothetical protein B0H14DRAFT_2867367, partial [Mycena olivaceomarginata]